MMQEYPGVYRFVVCPLTEPDARAKGYLADAHALGFTGVESIQVHDLYFIEGDLDRSALMRLGEELLSDRVVQTFTCHRLGEEAASPSGVKVVEVALRAGVTDPVAEQIVRAAQVMNIRGVKRAATGQRFLIKGGDLTESQLHLLAKRLLANPVIQRYELGWVQPAFPAEVSGSAQVERLKIRGVDLSGLMALSAARRAALDEAEMLAIQAYCEREGRDLTDVEFEMIAQTWSEHCVHKTFKALVEVENYEELPEEVQKAYPDGEVNNLMRTFLKAATDRIGADWVRSAFVDNAGILELDGFHEVSFKVETHNHPSAIEPFGGANTGVGGVIRDVLGVSARPVAATDVLCFGPQRWPFERLPEGVLHPRRIFSGVVAGVQDYGNKIGIPTVNGVILFDPGYVANPLVFCGCVGIAPRDSHPRNPLPGDRVVVIGGRTGRDGLRGATFSSMTMDAQTGEVSGASVQIGAPITEKGLIEVVMRARDAGLYHAITDCGAGGLSSAVGEMAADLGATVELDRVRLKYPGLAPWEIWLSEAQERMVLAIPPEKVEEFQRICDLFAVEMTDIGQFELSGRLVVRYRGQVVLDLDNHFLHCGIPQRRLKAHINLAPNCAPKKDCCRGAYTEGDDYQTVLLDLLSHPNIASKAQVVHLYDHEVQGGTVVKPLIGVFHDAPADAAVLRPAESVGDVAIVLASGINPEYGKVDAYRMAASVIDEAIRNAVAVGANPARIALLDNFCWGDPKRPDALGSLLEAARACYDTALNFGTPFISGKDSLNNEYVGMDGMRHAIPPTLLISALGLMEDFRLATTSDLKQAGDALYLIGAFNPRLGASHYRLVEQPDEIFDGEVPPLAEETPRVYHALHRAMTEGLVRACHDLSEGGLAVAAAEMCIGGRLGLDLDGGMGEPVCALFGESNGCLLVEVKPGEEKRFEQIFNGLPFRRAGRVRADDWFCVRMDGRMLIELPVISLVQAWQRPIQEGR